jgi:hypothetical protein
MFLLLGILPEYVLIENYSVNKITHAAFYRSLLLYTFFYIIEDFKLGFRLKHFVHSLLLLGKHEYIKVERAAIIIGKYLLMNSWHLYYKISIWLYMQTYI